MPGPPKRLALVIPVYNVVPYLPDLIDSIQRQSVGTGDLEVIAVDDGSTDDSPAILRAWAARSPELVTVVSQENGGGCGGAQHRTRPRHRNLGGLRRSRRRARPRGGTPRPAGRA